MRIRSLLLLVLAVPLALLLAGCATPPIRSVGAENSPCLAHFRALDAAVVAAGVADPGPTRVAGFPYLRVDRFLASFADELDTPRRFDAWVERLGQLDRQARGYEIAALTGVPQSRLVAESDRCRDTLIRSELSRVDNRRLLRRQAQVPDDYVTAWRALGLYPVTALFVEHGIRNWQTLARERAAEPLDRLPPQGRLRRWRPADAPRLGPDQVAAILAEAADNPLGIPEPTPEQRDRLFASFAPQWVIDTADGDDLPGSPSLGPDGPRVDTDRPAVYRLLSHTRFRGQVLPQLNYVIWFPARPAERPGDIYAGHFDGIDFRVTLGKDGRPLLFDTVHNCGCYHRVYPVAPLVPNTSALEDAPDPPLVLPQIRRPGAIPLLRVASRTHYVERLGFTDRVEGEPYVLDDYDGLRSLALPGGGRRGLFGEHGILAASARPERFVLWPMGIRSPGAMRQWGHHAVAFLGRRHFDDPYWIDQLFQLRGDRK